MIVPRKLAILGIAGIAAACPAQGTNVTFTGLVANVCVLTLSTPGTLGVSGSGTLLSSEETGGLNSTLSVVATGTNPTISFAAPQMTGPSSSTANAVKEMAYSSPGGGNQAYTSAASSYTMNRLIDTVAIKGRATNSGGFVSGTYGISSVVTCQQ